VFNQTYLDMDPQDAIAQLTTAPELQPEVARMFFVQTLHLLGACLLTQYTGALPTNARLTAIIAATNAHNEYVSRTLAAMQIQHEATRVACAGLDMNVLNVTDTFDAFAEPAERELLRQAGLLGHRHADLEIVARIRVHSEFLNSQQRVNARPRMLSDWIAADKMRQVGDRCAEVHGMKP